MMYRKDLLRDYGIPETPPADWPTFWRRMQKLTRPEAESAGVRHHIAAGPVSAPVPHYLYPWVWAAGGDFVMEGRPTGDREDPLVPERGTGLPRSGYGESLADRPSEWKVTLTTPEVIAAYDFLWRLFTLRGFATRQRGRISI